MVINDLDIDDSFGLLIKQICHKLKDDLMDNWSNWIIESIDGDCIRIKIIKGFSSVTW